MPVTEEQKKKLSELNPDWKLYMPNTKEKADCLIRLWKRNNLVTQQCL
nr:MAG TPA: hypothetical protein [Caudoviricetes sp.]